MEKIATKNNPKTFLYANRKISYWFMFSGYSDGKREVAVTIAATFLLGPFGPLLGLLASSKDQKVLDLYLDEFKINIAPSFYDLVHNIVIANIDDDVCEGTVTMSDNIQEYIPLLGKSNNHVDCIISWKSEFESKRFQYIYDISKKLSPITYREAYDAWIQYDWEYVDRWDYEEIFWNMMIALGSFSELYQLYSENIKKINDSRLKLLFDRLSLLYNLDEIDYLYFGYIYYVDGITKPKLDDSGIEFLANFIVSICTIDELILLWCKWTYLKKVMSLLFLDIIFNKIIDNSLKSQLNELLSLCYFNANSYSSTKKSVILSMIAKL